MKRLIILESRGMVGGACESIKLFIRNMDGKADLMIPKGEADYISARTLKNYYGSNIEHIYEFYLPYSVEHTVACEVYDADGMKRSRRIFEEHKRELYDFLDEKQYDWIHLNGLGLYPVLNKKYPMTLHMRQVFTGRTIEKQKRLYYLNQSRAIVYIDDASYAPFREMKKRHLVLANPVDQNGVNAISAQEVRKKYQISEECMVFTMAGTVSEGKGVGFVIESFQNFYKSSSYPCKLLIAGQGIGAYKEHCSRLAADNPDIRFLGQLSRQEMQQLYKISDYMVRAEEKPGIGRTAWEALYSGVGLIIQGNEELVQEISKEMGTCENIYAYEPRNKERLINVFLKLRKKKTEHKGRSNAEQYADIFNRFIEETI